MIELIAFFLAFLHLLEGNYVTAIVLGLMAFGA